jgi:hypothetical protein
MKIKQLAKIEKSELQMLCDSFRQEVEEAVTKIRKQRFRFYTLPQNELYRLLRLRVWVEKYQVDLTYILSKLLPFWKTWLPRKNLKRGDNYTKTEGLGVRIATLTGKKSENMLQEFIKQDFPSEQHITLRRNYLQSELLDKHMEHSDDGIKTASDQSKTLFDFVRPAGYLQYYRRRIRKLQSRREELVQQFKERPYRGNPFVG